MHCEVAVIRCRRRTGYWLASSSTYSQPPLDMRLAANEPNDLVLGFNCALRRLALSSEPPIDYHWGRPMRSANPCPAFLTI